MNDYYEIEDVFETDTQLGGKFPGLWLPPLFVILVGLLIGFVTSGVFINQSVTAASPELDTAVTDLILDPVSVTKPDSILDGLSGLFTAEVLYWQGDILRWSTETGLDPNMIATVMQIESCGDPRALSSAGAMGLFQVMPFHFQSTDNPYEPDTNSLRGLAYLSQSLQASNGDTRLAFAGYNGGISVIYKPESGWAAETQRYAYWASGIYQEASQGMASSERLQEWFSYGGASLCRQAAARLGLNP